MEAESAALLPPELRARLRAACSSLGARDVASAAFLGEGWGSTAYRVGPLTVRIPKSAASAAALALEPRLVPALEAAGVPFVPRAMRAIEDDRGRLLATAHEYVAGTPARDVPRARGGRREELARDLGSFLGALHSYPAAQALELGVPAPDLWEGHYVPLVEAARPHLGPRTREWLDALCQRFVAGGGIASAPRVLIHGDVDGRNVLLHPDGSLSGVIDYSDAMVADPALDFACILNDWSWGVLERVFAHYPLEVDTDARRRTAFYIAVGPLWDVRQGAITGDHALLGAGRARLAGRARAKQ